MPRHELVKFPDATSLERSVTLPARAATTQLRHTSRPSTAAIATSTAVRNRRLRGIPVGWSVHGSTTELPAVGSGASGTGRSRAVHGGRRPATYRAVESLLYAGYRGPRPTPGWSVRPRIAIIRCIR